MAQHAELDSICTVKVMLEAELRPFLAASSKSRAQQLRCQWRQQQVSRIQRQLQLWQQRGQPRTTATPQAAAAHLRILHGRVQRLIGGVTERT